MSDTIIGRITKDKTSEIRFGINEYKDKKSICIREWFKTDKMKDWSPTKKGVNIPLGEASAVVSLAEKIEDTLRKQ